MHLQIKVNGKKCCIIKGRCDYFKFILRFWNPVSVNILTCFSSLGSFYILCGNLVFCQTFLCDTLSLLIFILLWSVRKQFIYYTFGIYVEYSHFVCFLCFEGGRIGRTWHSWLSELKYAFLPLHLFTHLLVFFPLKIFLLYYTSHKICLGNWNGSAAYLEI